MNQNQIAEAVGKSQTAISHIINGDRMPSPKMAEDLEKATGICRESWLYPDWHYNPYIPFKDAKLNCITCNKLTVKLKWLAKWALEHFIANIDDPDVFQDLACAITDIVGVDTGAVITFGELVPEGLRALGGCPPINEDDIILLPKEEYPNLYNMVVKEHVIAIPHFPYGMNKDWVEEISVFEGDRIKSIGIVARKGLVFTNLSYRYALTPQGENMALMQDVMSSLADLWAAHKSQAR